jgi:hypothetical protein
MPTPPNKPRPAGKWLCQPSGFFKAMPRNSASGIIYSSTSDIRRVVIARLLGL